MQLFEKTIKKTHHESGITTIIISSDEMEHIMKIVKSLKESELLVKGISETTKNETEEQKGRIIFSNAIKNISC